MATNASAPKPRSVDSGRVVDGVVALLFTPFTADGSRFDAAGMRRQLDFVLESGVSAVVACGKAGEFEGQSLEEIEEVLNTVLAHVRGRIPVGMGIISVEEDRGVPAAELAARCGADFAMTKKFGKRDLHGFFSQIAERIPVMLYDQTNEGNLDVAGEVLPLVESIERIMTVKVSGNVYAFDQLKRAAPQVTYICGWDTFSLPAYISGSDGVVAGSAAFMPEREVELHRLVQAHEWDDARRLFYHRMLPMIAYCTPDPYAFSVCKHILHWKGLFDSPVVRAPYLNAPPWLQRELRELAQQLGLVDGS